MCLLCDYMQRTWANNWYKFGRCFVWAVCSSECGLFLLLSCVHVCLSVCRMREVEIGEGKALLVYQGGEYMACGHKCTHYGAPLAKGFLGNGRVRCPWHGACFNVKTGDIEDFPGLDGIPVHQVWREGGREERRKGGVGEGRGGKGKEGESWYSYCCGQCWHKFPITCTVCASLRLLLCGHV